MFDDLIWVFHACLQETACVLFSWVPTPYFFYLALFNMALLQRFLFYFV